MRKALIAALRSIPAVVAFGSIHAIFASADRELPLWMVGIMGGSQDLVSCGGGLRRFEASLGAISTDACAAGAAVDDVVSALPLTHISEFGTIQIITARIEEDQFISAPLEAYRCGLRMEGAWQPVA